ncbi:(Fe-S)-binding protein [Maledivibacter halophilus]|uniref:Fe-S oxidoreductase n=1 Tax=Maledivibacter halophilus TaxID=36842 RepID=A0A1T5L2U8_9FIRM|nr:(Fe-S)-binding protein [Maledivibacter halophilus]SKC70263.1 Fe-S oxidoreductase [Maledivibacter halophilus]
MNIVFAPGCALMIYKPLLADRLLKYLKENNDCKDKHLICCRHEPNLKKGTKIINVCSGCHKRYSELYDGISTISLWEVLAESETFPFPDYRGKAMTIHDACPTRTNGKVHKAIRTLLFKMNIKVVEPERTRENGVCCGDSFYGFMSNEKVKHQMKKRADEMPLEDVIVHCVSCVKSMINGGKTPRYLIDLLFNEKTHGGQCEPREWHDILDKFISEH